VPGGVSFSGEHYYASSSPNHRGGASAGAGGYGGRPGGAGGIGARGGVGGRIPRQYRSADNFSEDDRDMRIIVRGGVYEVMEQGCLMQTLRS
jgi:hypothetical protein